MSPDKQVQEGMGAGLTQKQKLMAAGVVVILIIVIWQVVGLFGGGGSASAPVAPIKSAAPMTAAMSAQGGGAPAGMNPAMSNAMNNANSTAMVVPQPAPVLRDQGSSNADILQNQQSEQKKYLSSVNELQMLKLQRDIAETNQGIAAAKLATATAEQNINSMLTKPVPAPVPVGDYANKLGSPDAIQQSAPGSNGPGPNQPPAPVATPEVTYVVISVSMQMHRWTAVLGYQGKLYNVMVGDVLPMDGWVVASINKEGVVLKKDDMKRKISLIPVI